MEPVISNSVDLTALAARAAAASSREDAWDVLDEVRRTEVLTRIDAAGEVDAWCARILDLIDRDFAADLRGVRLELTPEGERALEGAELRMCQALLEQAREAGSERIAELRRLFVRAFLRLAAETRQTTPQWPAESQTASPPSR